MLSRATFDSFSDKRPEDAAGHDDDGPHHEHELKLPGKIVSSNGEELADGRVRFTHALDAPTKIDVVAEVTDYGHIVLTVVPVLGVSVLAGMSRYAAAPLQCRVSTTPSFRRLKKPHVVTHGFLVAQPATRPFRSAAFSAPKHQPQRSKAP